jgi:hypothetical protein
MNRRGLHPISNLNEIVSDKLIKYLSYQPRYAYPLDSWTENTRKLRNMFWHHLDYIFPSDNTLMKNYAMQIARVIERNTIDDCENASQGETARWSSIPNNYYVWRFVACIAMIYRFLAQDPTQHAWMHENLFPDATEVQLVFHFQPIAQHPIHVFDLLNGPNLHVRIHRLEEKLAPHFESMFGQSPGDPMVPPAPL